MPPAPPPPTASPSPEPAGLARRFAALCYDGLLLGGLLFVYTLAVLAVRRGEAIEPGTLWFETSLVGVALVFFGWSWTHGGQTVGMRAWHIRVVTETGADVDWRRAALRFFAAWFAALPAGLGFWWSWFDSRRRCWHDRWSGTALIRVPSRTRGGETPIVSAPESSQTS